MNSAKSRLVFTSALLLAIAASAQQVPPPQSTADPLHAWISARDASSLEAWVNQRLAEEKADIDKLIAVTGPRTVENTLVPFDDAENQLTLAGNNANLLYSMADSAPIRDKAQALEAVISSAGTDLGLNQKVYAALAAVPLPADDPATKHYLEHTLLEYRLTGVDKDDTQLAKIRALQDKITALSLTFGRNVADGTLKVKATKDELDGMPADYIARHKPETDGSYTLTTDEPDSRPVFTFARSPDLRRRMFLAYYGRAYPANLPVLKDLLAARQDLATALGYANYADLATADQMMASSSHVETLLKDLDDASRTIAKREYDQLLAFAQQQQPGLTSISASDAGYWSEQYKRAKYDFDAQSVRPYFPYSQVQPGILSTAARLFHVEFRPVKDAVVWDKSVDTFDVFDTAPPNQGKQLGRIYLDMHPREGKDKWFSSGPVVPGIQGRQLPEGMLICNFSGGTAGDPGLMQYSEVVTFFHEFGHLMHYILGSQGRWAGEGSFSVEGDFVEAPSQMLEEMFHDTAILQSFGKHYQTGEVIPASVIAKMNAASAYGRGSWMQGQLEYAVFMVQIHDRPPAEVDLDALYRQAAERYSPYTWVDGNRYYASFTWVTGYASNLYTYPLDKVIAVDFFTQFDKKNLLDGPAAMRYRRAVLEPGASKPATELVKDFLGRPQQFDALKAWLSEEFQTPATASH